MSRKFKNIIQIILIILLIGTTIATMVFARYDFLDKLKEQSVTTQEQIQPPEKSDSGSSDKLEPPTDNPDKNTEDNSDTLNSDSDNNFEDKDLDSKNDSNQDKYSDKEVTTPDKSQSDTNSDSVDENIEDPTKASFTQIDTISPVAYSNEIKDYQIQSTETAPPEAPPESNDTNNQDMMRILPDLLKNYMDSSSKMDFFGISYWFLTLFVIQAALISIILVYLFMSRFNRKTFKETFKNRDKVTIFLLSILIWTTIITYLDVYITRNYIIGELTETVSQENIEIPQTPQEAPGTGNSNSAELSGKETVDAVSNILSGDYSTSTENESVIYALNNGDAAISNSTISKSGDTTDNENSEFYGQNAAILVDNAKSTISDTTINSNAKGANAVFSTGENADVTIAKSTISTKQDGSRGLMATAQGKLTASEMNITTQGQSSGAIATDRGGGTISVTDSEFQTSGIGSPLIYCTGNITVDKSKGTANKAQIAVIEGKNTLELNDSDFTCTGQGVRGDTNSNSVDQAGIMLYQSMSGDAEQGDSELTLKGTKLSIDNKSDLYETAPMFFTTNTSSIINIENTTLSFGSHLLLSAKATDEWGKTGKNGADVTFNATNQELSGNIEVDDLSTLKMNLKDADYTGMINTDNSAQDIDLTLDKDSTLSLTGDTYISSLDNEVEDNSNIKLNNFKLYVDGKELQ